VPYDIDMKDQQDVQYMTCDHNCVVITGFISDIVRREWKDVRNDVTSTGVDELAVSANREWRVEIEGELRLRENVCRMDEERPREWDMGEGDGGRAWKFGDPGTGVFRGLEGAVEGEVEGAFIFVNGLKNDHSDSNCTNSKSRSAGVWSSKAASRNRSIFLSTYLIIKTVPLMRTW
jgi:hypothetical protein